MDDGSSTGAPRAEQKQRDYAGAIYGSLLAASVVAGTSPRREPPRPGELIVLLVATGVVFWLAHVYAGVVGERSEGAFLSMAKFRTVAGREWPLVQATVPPAAAAAIGALIGLSDSGVAWLALAVAIGAQLGWALYVAAKAGATWRGMALSGLVYLVLGMVIVALKAFLSH